MASRTIDWGGLDEAMTAHPAVSVPFIRVDDVVERLETFRKGIERDGSMTEMGFSMDYVLWDICEILELSQDETKRVLGAKTYTRLKTEIYG